MAGQGREGLKLRRRRNAFAAAAAAIALAGCSTVPRTLENRRDEFAAVGSGGAFYLRADVPACRPLLDALVDAMAAADPAGNPRPRLDAKSARKALDATESVVVVLGTGLGGSGWSAHARGRYPSAWASFSLGFDPAWKRGKGPGGAAYWRNKEGLALRFTADGAALSDGEPFPRGPAPAVPDSAADALDAYAAVAWPADPAAFAEAALGPLASIARTRPTAAALLLERNADGKYVVEARLDFASAREARALEAVFRLASGVVPATGSPEPGDARSAAAWLSARVLAGAVSRSEGSLVLRSAPAAPADLALLWPAVSVYF